MKMIHLIGLMILFTHIVACANNSAETTGNETTSAPPFIAAATTDTFETGKVISHVVCKSDAAQSYALYIPVTGNNKNLPAMYFFDPHGDGTLPLTKYKSLADRYKFILIGSNNSKNGNDWPMADNIWNVLQNDTKQRLRMDASRIYVCGFSGGAKVASYLALNHHEIKGVLGGGAALPDAAIVNNVKCSFTTIAGEGDMNITDLISFDDALYKTKTRHRIIFFDGIHEWWPEPTMQIAFAGLQLDAIIEKLILKDDPFINDYCSASRKRISGYIQSNNYIRAEAECLLSINLLSGATNTVNEFVQKDSNLIANAVYQKQRQQRQDILNTEQKTKQLYSQHFQQADINYWTNTIHALQQNSKAKTAEGAMHQRLLAYLSLAFYSVSNQLINNHRDKEAAYFVDLYKMDDATNPEAWYFSAIINARANNAKAATDDLIKAVENGFTDSKRMETQNEFRSIAINFAAIEKRMKR